jgi:hypothetical protein
VEKQFEQNHLDNVEVGTFCLAVTGWHTCIYCQTCYEQPPLGQRKYDSIKQLTIYLKSVNLQCQFWTIMIRVLLLLVIGKHDVIQLTVTIYI